MPPHDFSGQHPVRVRAIDEAPFLIEDDVGIVVRDGTRLSARVFRPKEAGTYPVVMAFTAYGKDSGPEGYPGILQWARPPVYDLGRFEVSEWTPWEGPDPAFWVPNGYALVVVDTRGYHASEGKASILSAQDREDFYDAIEWAGTQPWSNGRVGLNGVSYLAISQWLVAGAQPPHLAAIVPWEGNTDSFREVLYHGGIPETAFTGFWFQRMRTLGNTSPLPPRGVFQYLFKRPRLLQRVRPGPPITLSTIEVPALVCATWSDQGLHSRGSFLGYETIASEEKWLYTHGRSKWATYYSEEALKTQRAFFDHYLAGVDNGFEETPRVRLEVRDTRDRYTVHYEDTWPLEQTAYTPLYLDASSHGLSTAAPTEPSEVAYDALTGQAIFTLRFENDTELTGWMALRLWVSMDSGEDLDLFVGVEKLDTAGQVVPFYAKTGFMNGPVAMGWLRASERALDSQASKPWRPVLAHTERTPVPQNEPFPVNVEILPSSTLFRKGESLRLVVQGRDLFEHRTLGHKYAVNRGTHRIHTGGSFDTNLLVPVIPRPIPDDPE